MMALLLKRRISLRDCLIQLRVRLAKKTHFQESRPGFQQAQRRTAPNAAKAAQDPEIEESAQNSEQASVSSFHINFYQWFEQCWKDNVLKSYRSSSDVEWFGKYKQEFKQDEEFQGELHKDYDSIRQQC